MHLVFGQDSGTVNLRIVVIEDDGRYRHGLAELFGQAEGFTLAGSYRSAQAALADLDAAMRAGTMPAWDAALVDLQLPGMSGIEATRRLKEHLPHLPIVILTVFEEPATILEAICAGADGYLLKKTSTGDLLGAIRGITAGGAPMTAGVARTVLHLLRTSGRGPRAQFSHGPERLDLTDREQDVLRELVRGLSYKQAADTLGISTDTVRTHVRAVYRKLQVHSVAEAVSRAVREKLV
jgi:DNA-binding NarL/FixJ family response regulator